MNELKTIFVEGRTFNVLGANIQIKTISVGDIPVVLGIVEKVFHILPKIKTEKDKNALMLKAIKEEFGEVMKLLEVTTDIPADQISKLNLAALSLILAEVIKENSDFLSQNVIPNLEKLFQDFQEQKNKVPTGSLKSKS